MNGALESAAATGGRARAAFGRREWRQLAIISAAAAAIYLGLRWMPTGTNLSHMDFRVEGKGALDFCDPLNPQFISVVAARSPVSLKVTTGQPARAGERVTGVVTLTTAAGKSITPRDLLVVHERPLHLMLVDPSLTDYQHVHPEPGAQPGTWAFSFTPRHGGTYRLFADFTPVATARGLYANVDLPVQGAEVARGPRSPGEPEFAAVEQQGIRFQLTPAQPVKAGAAVDYTFSMTALSGGSVPLQPVMGAYAHLVAFDPERTGFAHLHPAQEDPSAAPDAQRPSLSFKLTIPKPGRYVTWAQVNLAGQDTFVPFWFTVTE